VTDAGSAGRRSAREWLFQLTTITVGVLIALSFDALLKWNADRELVEQARATIMIEIAENRRELDEHLKSIEDRVAGVENGLKLLAEYDSGVEPTIHEVRLSVNMPSLNDAGWQTAERTGATALMQYSEVQRLAEVYTLQALFNETMRPQFVAATEAGVGMNSPGDAFAAPAMREATRARLIELRAYLELDRQLGRQLLEGYSQFER
jgi:hypothetical protein